MKTTKDMMIDEIWKQCIKMWRWIVRQIEAGDERTIHKLKRTWLQEHGFSPSIHGACFFCESCTNCGNCPGAIIDECFSCFRDDIAYNLHPKAFLKELFHLDNIRRTA